uniref:Uncharacterized protein n=1 Tax=Triticum urartu TaxID=4572 RepID=A0A8R7PYB6_TRIUA
MTISWWIFWLCQSVLNPRNIVVHGIFRSSLMLIVSLGSLLCCIGS